MTRTGISVTVYLRTSSERDFQLVQSSRDALSCFDPAFRGRVCEYGRADAERREAFAAFANALEADASWLR